MLTCHKCNVIFESRAEANAHYKSRWHEYNLMRALNLLQPASEASYEAAYQQLLSNQESALLTKSYTCAPCHKSFSSEGSHKSHLQSRRHASTLASLASTNPDQRFTSAGPGQLTSSDLTFDDGWQDVLCQQRCLQCGIPHATLRSCQRHMNHKPHLTLPLPGPYDHCYMWQQLEASLILAATAATDSVASRDEQPPPRLQLPTGSVAAHRRATRPRRRKTVVRTVAVRRRVVGIKPPHGGRMAVAVVPKKRHQLYGQKPAHAKRPVTKNLHKVMLPC
ncbi:Zinc finger C2H2-type [Trinorchestia longiramus]|nr:Zinc finger C2H2-type [Trinorchestia longiramus]